MAINNVMTRLKRHYKRLNGCTIEYEITPFQKLVEQIKIRQKTLSNKSNDQLTQVSGNLVVQLKDGQSLDALLIEAFALVKEAAFRVLKIHPFDEQIIGGIALHQGKLIEMQTGEGKTLTAVFPAYLNALSGQGVHVLTFNDYLARRDAQWMGPIYNLLGLKVGIVQEGMSQDHRQQAYNADITYVTAKEAGFDYLRDSLCLDQKAMVHRPFHYTIIDEADSILIDEARIPLVIAEAAEGSGTERPVITRMVRRLQEKSDYDLDEYGRNIYLTEKGINLIEDTLQCKNLYADENNDLLMKVNCALHAEFLLQRDVDYIIRAGKVELVDEFTGRIADKRRWPDGVQAAIEAKENLSTQTQGKILNSMSLQYFLQTYPKIGGMTATAQQAEEEFREFYGLSIVVIPPHTPCIRKDYEDQVLPTKQEKYQALIQEIKQVHQTQRPILVGTQSVKESYTIAGLLKKESIYCQVLNAKNDEFEAGIIAQAGIPGAVTVSTNMAGRGTDIRLGGADEKQKKEVVKRGGLYVIGVNRHESRRIDNQLRGRAGRQGDPGSSCFFISLEDDLMLKYRLRELIPDALFKEQPQGKITHPYITKEINRVQRIIEGQNLEIKITLCKYSMLIEQQRQILGKKRQEIMNDDQLNIYIQFSFPKQYEALKEKWDQGILNKAMKYILLFTMNKYWALYLADMEIVREGIHLRRFGGQDPLFEFQKIAITSFDKLQRSFEQEVAHTLDKLHTISNVGDLGLKIPSATWTYLINDDPFKIFSAMRISQDIGLSVGMLLTWPLLFVYYVIKKFRRQK